MKIHYYRRLSQILFFIIIIYGGFIIANLFSIQPSPPVSGTEKEINLIDAYLPIHSCRYNEPKPTLFNSCSMRYLLDRPLYFNYKTAFALLLPVGIIIALYFIFARFLCGWVCPFGFISELADSTRKKLKISSVELNDKTKKIVKISKYSILLSLIFLAFSVLLPFAYGLFMNKDAFAVACQICPVKFVMPLFNGNIPIVPPFLTFLTSFFTIISLVFLLIFIASIAITRPWCRICPNGAFLSLFNKGALIEKQKDVRKCTHCGICKRVCPFRNDYVLDEKTKIHISDTECIMCFKCIDHCPEEDCLKVKIFNKNLFRSKFKK